ncbi:unnamed protein product [Rotaria sp. Silwood2]|nr:unnamed protein product [Rotaria sp. Silwood2]
MHRFIEAMINVLIESGRRAQRFSLQNTLMITTTHFKSKLEPSAPTTIGIHRKSTSLITESYVVALPCRIHDLQVHLARYKVEIIQSITNIENESATKIMFLRQIRKHLERELIEENESLRNELFHRTDINEVMLERGKQCEEVLI